jgi:DoxX-like family
MENVLISQSSYTPVNTRGAATAAVWIGRALAGLAAAFLLLDAACKLIPLAIVVETTAKLGYDVSVIRPLGLILAAATLLYLLPRTQLVGAALLTAYLGGATATHVHSHTPFWFPVLFGLVLWVGYALRSPALRALLTSGSSSPRRPV